MIELLLVFLTIVAIIIASYTDFKKREIPDWVSWGLVGVGIFGHIAISLQRMSFKPALISLGAATIFFIVANITFYSGFWGGGDAKLLIGIAAAVPIYPLLLNNYVAPLLAPWPFLVSLTLNIIIFGAAYGLLYMVAIAAWNWKKFGKQFIKLFIKYKLSRVFLILLAIPMLFILNRTAVKLFTPLILFVVVVPFLFIFSKAAESLLVYSQKVSKLVSGDRPIGELRVKGKLVYGGRLIGLTEEDIAKIRLAIGKQAKIKLKDGIPYAPAFLIGLFFTLIVGDLILVILRSLI